MILPLIYNDIDSEFLAKENFVVIGTKDDKETMFDLDGTIITNK